MKRKMKRLNFGCGPDIRKGWDNCDIQKAKGVIFCNADKFPYPFKNNTYDYILLRESLEYIDNPIKGLVELRRIAKPSAILDIEVPYYNNKGAYNDFYVTHHFSDASFKAFVEQTYNIHKEKLFEIEYLELIPTKVGKFIPKIVRNKLSLFFGGFISKVRVKLRVVK